MTNEELNTRLYEKMAAEQTQYRNWLLTLPPAGLLQHAYEYSAREDIVMCMEELELPDKQAKALTELLSGDYLVASYPPPSGKDYNDYLCHLKGISKQQHTERSDTR